VTVRVRPGVPGDAARLAAFGARTFEETFGAENTPEDMASYMAHAYGIAQQAAELADPAVVTLIAEEGAAMAGYAQLRGRPAPPCVAGPAPIELWRFYVDRPWQGRGVAAALMSAIVEAAAARGAATLWLCVWERNPRAQAFYRKAGFADVGAAEFVLGTDRQTDRVMVRPIQDRRPCASSA
jgi:ribosomal protein S18 acetylase RimI-like enzyme